MLGPFNQPGVDETGFYVPFFSNPVGPGAAGAVRRTSSPRSWSKPRGGQRADAMAVALRQRMTKADPNLPLYFVGTPKSQLDGFVAQNRIIATMFTIFGVVAIVLASVGMYGVMSFSVNQRRQEFGVRMALGAHYLRILRMVLTQGAIQLALGLFIGLGLALGSRHAGRFRNSEHPLRRHGPRPDHLQRGRRRSSRSSRSSRRWFRPAAPPGSIR